MDCKGGARYWIVKGEPENGLLSGSPKMDCKGGAPKWIVKGESQNGLYKGSPKMDFTGDVMFQNGLKTGIK